MELFLADFVNVPEYVEKFLSVPRPWSRHEYILYTPAFLSELVDSLRDLDDLAQ